MNLENRVKLVQAISKETLSKEDIHYLKKVLITLTDEEFEKELEFLREELN